MRDIFASRKTLKNFTSRCASRSFQTRDRDAETTSVDNEHFHARAESEIHDECHRNRRVIYTCVAHLSVTRGIVRNRNEAIETTPRAMPRLTDKNLIEWNLFASFFYFVRQSLSPVFSLKIPVQIQILNPRPIFASAVLLTVSVWSAVLSRNYDCATYRSVFRSNQSKLLQSLAD